MSRPKARWLKLSLGLATTAVFAWLLAHWLDLDGLHRAFARLEVSTLLLVQGTLITSHALRIVRWWLLLRAVEPKLTLRACVRPYLAGMGLNHVMPFRAGDALRVLGFRRQLRSPAMRVLGTLVLERAMDVVVVSGIFFLSLAQLPEGVLPRGIVTAVSWLAAVGMAAILGALLFPPLFERLGSGMAGRRSLAGDRWPAALTRSITHLVEAAGSVRSLPRITALVGLTAVVWICEGAAFVAVASMLAAGVAPLGPWLSLAAAALATSIPSAPGHLGTFDYFAALGLVAYGAPTEIAVAAALTIHASWIPITVVGLLCLLPFGAGQHQPPSRTNPALPR